MMSAYSCHLLATTEIQILRKQEIILQRSRALFIFFFSRWRFWIPQYIAFYRSQFHFYRFLWNSRGPLSCKLAFEKWTKKWAKIPEI
jgi:hypothetical protein